MLYWILISRDHFGADERIIAASTVDLAELVGKAYCAAQHPARHYVRVKPFTVADESILSLEKLAETKKANRKAKEDDKREAQ